MSAPKLFEESNYEPYVGNYTRDWSWVSPYFKLLVDGYCIVDVNDDRVKVEYWINDNTRSRETKSVLDATFCVYDGVVEFEECVDESEPDDDELSDKTRAWMIISIVFIILFVIALAVLLWLCYQRRTNSTVIYGATSV